MFEAFAIAKHCELNGFTVIPVRKFRLFPYVTDFKQNLLPIHDKAY